jgi:hypothetical protein
MNEPNEFHLTEAKRILRHLQGTKEFNWLVGCTDSESVIGQFQLMIARAPCCIFVIHIVI